MSKEFQIRDGNLIASFDLENEDDDIDFCKLFKVSHGVADEIGMFVDYVATNKIIKDQSKQISDLEAKLAESENSLKCTIDHYEKYCAELNRQNVMLYASAFNHAQFDQDKISFALEQLEKVKEWTHDNASYVLGDFASVWEDALLDELDNQIKQLKEIE